MSNRLKIAEKKSKKKIELIRFFFKGLAILLISLPTFIVIHRIVPNLEWKYNIDRLLIYILIIISLYFLMRFFKKAFITIFFIISLFFIIETIRGGYGILSLLQDYQVLIHSMNDLEKPKKILLKRIVFNSSDRQIVQSVDYTNPEVRNFALQATKKYFKEYQNYDKYRTIIQCLAVFKEINSQWNYVNDPKEREYYAKASESIQTLSGDCDDYTILMSACIKIIGGTPRMVYTIGHIYPEILIGKEEDLETIDYLIKNKLFFLESKGKSLYYHIDQDENIWLNLDYTARYPGGPFMHEEVLGVINQ